MSTFTTNRSLLNPKFESYKLSPLSQADHVHRHPLTSRATQANVSGKTRVPLSFEEVQSRIRHNHLTISLNGRSAFYIDDHSNVIRIVLGTDLEPTFTPIFEIPRQVESVEQADEQHKEYASVLQVSLDLILVSDGTGLLYVLSDDPSDSSTRQTAVYELPGQASTTPFKLHAAHIAPSNGQTVSCILSSRVAISSGSAHTVTHFDIWCVSLPVPRNSDTPEPLTVLWHGRGADVPIHCGFDEARESFYLLGGSVYRAVDAPTRPSYTPSEDEIAPIPRAGETPADFNTKPPPYSWTQTSDSVTVAFPLPSNLAKAAIKVTLTPHTLSLLITPELPMPIELPHYSIKPVWDGINPSSSYWTWDREADKRFGMLTLHLDKQHEGTKWMHVFASAGTGTTIDPTDIDVPETLDPSELWLIREALEKYTSALLEGEDPSGLGLGRGAPSLAEGEMDDTVDASVGSECYVSWVGVNGVTPEWAAASQNGLSSSLLSTQLPGFREEANSLVMKSDIDGLLFKLTEQGGVWKHTSTFPALAFVLASKRDTRFTHHISSRAVLAFESGAGFGSGNLYIYYSPSGKATWAKQGILRVSGGASGSLLGIGVLNSESGDVLLCLCEAELIVVKSLLV